MIMFKGELKRTTGGASLLVLVSIIFLVVLALSFAMHCDIAVQRAYACPPPTKTWSAGSAINNPSITAPTNNGYYGRNEIKCFCNTPTDSDHWTQGENQGDSVDTAVKATWSDGNAGGSWLNGKNTGAEVTYIPAGTGGPIRLTVTFDDTGTVQYDDSAKSAYVDVYVGDAQLRFMVGGNPTNSITRGQTGTFEVVDSNNQPISGATYSDWNFFGQINVGDPTNTSRTWGGTIVESGYATVKVAFGGHTYSLAKTISVTPRSGWSITPVCQEDVSSSFGSYPMMSITNVYGDNKAKDHDSGAIIWPRGIDYQDGYTTTQIGSGPNINIWYISASIFAIERETRINKYTKENVSAPTNPPLEKWHEINEQLLGLNMDSFVVGIGCHEYKGRTPTWEGHEKFLEDKENGNGMDAKTAIEDNIAETENDLKSITGVEVNVIDIAIYGACAKEPAEGSNWGLYKMLFWNGQEWRETTSPIGL